MNGPLDPGTLRALAAEDVETCVEVASAVGWQTDPHQWQWMLSLGEGQGAWLGDGTLAGTIVTFSFGAELTTIAMMLVRPTCQRRGIGRRLMEEALRRSTSRLVGLYATPAGEKLYRVLGFSDAGSSTRFEGTPAIAAEPSAGDLRPMTRSDLAAVVALDEAAQGTPRERLVRSLFEEHDGAWVVERAGHVAGFGLATSKRGTRRLGPIVARLDEDGVALANRLALGAPSVLLDLEPGEGPLTAWARGRGLHEKETSLRMMRGAGGLAGERAWSRTLAGRQFG